MLLPPRPRRSMPTGFEVASYGEVWGLVRMRTEVERRHVRDVED